MNASASQDTLLLLWGRDPSAVSHLVSEVQGKLLGKQDANLALTRFSAAEYVAEGAAASIVGVVEACMTPPMFTPYRVIVARELGIFKPADLEALLSYLKDPMPTTKLLLVWEKPVGQSALERLPPDLSKAVESAGGLLMAADAAQGKAGRAWLKEECRLAKVRLDSGAFNLLVERLGEDRTRVWGILDALHGAYGEAAQLKAGDVAPYLGEFGSAPPWGLTDAISRGDFGSAQEQLERLLGSGERHPLQIMASLNVYFERILRLDGASVRNAGEAAVLLRQSGALPKSGSPFPARVALQASKKVGGWKIRRVYELMAAADLDLRGRSGMNSTVVLEVLVARLAQLHR